MSRLPRHVTALASGLAVAATGFLAAPAEAQNHPYAATGSYEQVTDTDVSKGGVVYDYNTTHDYQDVKEKDVTDNELSPDILRPEEPPLDTSTQEAAGRAIDKQRSRETLARKHFRQSERIYSDYSDQQRHTYVQPYIEAAQIVDAQLSPNAQTFTYSVLAAGVDASVDRKNVQGSASVRYERRFGWGNAQSFDNVSGVAHGIAAIVPDKLHLEVAGYANRTHVEASGATINGISSPSGNTQIYTIMGGPSLATDAGNLQIQGHYRIGYSHVGTPTGVVASGSNPQYADIFEHSTVQDAKLRVGTRPGDVLPVGVAVEGGHYQEDISNLAQRARDSHVRGEVTIPIAYDAAIVGGVGYENVQVSSKDALRDANGNVVYDKNGRIVTNQAGPRYIAFDTEGLIWDVGVIWRPSPRTNLEAHVGRRYGEFGGYGTFSYKPNGRSSINLLAYNNMAGFGGMLTNSLFNLPTQFEVMRNAMTGNISNCVSSSGSGNCLTGSLATVRSSVFRSRGVSATVNHDFDRFQVGVGAGFDRRQYIAAPGTVLAALDGKVERYYWVAGYLISQLDRQTTLTTTLDTYWFDTDVVNNGNFQAVRATAVLQHQFTKRLAGTAAIGIDDINRRALDDVWDASGSVGLRYAF